jgi:hypothetical protein
MFATHALPESVSAVDSMLTFTRVQSIRPGDEVVSFLSVWHWLKGRAESPEPLLVSAITTDGNDFEVATGYRSGEPAEIRVKGIGCFYRVSDPILKG